MSDRTSFEVNESRRTVIAVDGHKEVFHNVTKVDVGGNWTRFYCDQGYVMLNPANVLCIIAEGDQVR